MPAIHMDQLTKYYGKQKGIENVSLDVEEGEIFGFIGPNGAGKSTTIRTLLGLIFPTSGKAEIFGRDCIKHGHELRSSIGYLPSEVFYYEKMKVKDLLKYSASFYKGDFTDRIKELSDLMELDLNRRIEDLSYGNKKKVGIVQGLLHRPKLVFLDEPTGGLDPLMQKKFFQLIRKENQEGVTVFFSSHILSEVQYLCHRVAIIKDGAIIRTEAIEDLQKESYKKIHLKGRKLSREDYQHLNITNYHADQHNGVQFFYRGPIDELLKAIDHRKIDDILIENPSLEEIFLHYYE